MDYIVLWMFHTNGIVDKNFLAKDKKSAIIST